MLLDNLFAAMSAAILVYGLLRFALGQRWGQRIAPDIPNDRSLHSNPVPRIGGIVLIPLALLIACTASWQIGGLLSTLAFLLCAISFLDDRRGLSVRIRLLFHVCAAFLLCYGYGWPSAWQLIVGAVILTWAINLYNFMDGADGLAGEMAVIGFSAFGWALLDLQPDLSLFAFSVAGAALGFLVLNFSPARVFMGDSGSVPLGFLAGGVGIDGWLRGAWPVWFPFIVFAPFVIDASATILKRIARREKFWSAHREHYYQRFIRMGNSHRNLALVELGLMLGCAMIGLLVRESSALIQASGIALCIIVHVLLMVAIDRRWNKYGAGI